MAKKWTIPEERAKRRELRRLYVKQNKTITEIAGILDLAESGVYDRLLRLGIPSLRHKKQRFNNRNFHIFVPKIFSPQLAEFLGIMLGDGHLTPTQVCVTLGNKEQQYAEYVSVLMEHLFKVKPKIMVSNQGCAIVYIGSTVLVRWLFKDFGLVYNKVKSQVDVPKLCFSKAIFMRMSVRGFFDTDGSIYRLRHGIQMSFTNRSEPLLESMRRMVKLLGFYHSAVSHYKFYLTRRDDIRRYCKIIGFSNSRHQERLKFFMASKGGSYSGNYT